MNEAKLQLVERVEKEHKLAFKIQDAAKVMSVSVTTFGRLLRKRKIYATKDLRLVPKEEILRYLREQILAAKNNKRWAAAHHPSPTWTQNHTQNENQNEVVAH